MNFPKFIENAVLNSDSVKGKLAQEQSTKLNREVAQEVQRALKAAKKGWSLETAKAIDRKFGKPRKFVTSSGNQTTSDSLLSSNYSSGKNYSTISTLFSDSPGSIQSAARIRDAVLGGGYVIKPPSEGQGLKGTKKDLRKAIEFFDRPNPEDTIETLLGVSIENYLAYGNFYWEKVPTKKTAKSKKMEVAALYNLDPVMVSILVDAKKKKQGVLEKIGYNQRTEANKGITYSLDEIFHLRRANRRADLYGRAVLEDNMATLQLLIRALTYNINILKNGGRPPLQLILPEDSTEADAESVSSWYEKNYQGEHNAGKALVTFKGAEAKPLGITPQDMAYLELLRYGLRLVAGQYGVPLLLVGFPEDSNRAVSSEARRAFYLTTVFILRKLISQKITREIIEEGLGISGWKLDFKTAGLEESEASRRDFILARDKGLLTMNQARVAMGQTPIDKPWADKYYLVTSKNESLIPVEEAINREPDSSAPDSSNDGSTRQPGETNPATDDATHDK